MIVSTQATAGTWATGPKVYLWPFQAPSYAASRSRATSTQTIVAGGNADELVFNGTVFDPMSLMDGSSTGRFYPREPGIYRFNWMLLFNSSGGLTTIEGSLRVNSTTGADGTRIRYITTTTPTDIATSGTMIIGSAMYELVTGDYVSLWMEPTGANVNLNQNTASFFEMEMVRSTY